MPIEEDAQPSNVGSLAEEIRKDQAEGNLNLDSEQLLGSTEHVFSKMNPLEATGLEDDYQPELKEYDQGFLTDATAGLYNSLVLDLGEGLANLVPTIAQAAGATNGENESEWTETWKNGVSTWFDGQKVIYSDKAYAPINGFSDITSSHVAQGIGQGVGFIVGIAGGAGWAGAISKGGKAISAITTLQKAGKAVEATNVLSKTGKTMKALNKSEQVAKRIGSFMTGTTLMYPMIDKEARAAGLSPTDASRFALGVAGIVSLTEGAALESIGVIAAKPFTASITKSATNSALKQAGKKGPLELQKLFLKDFTTSVKGNMSKIIKSASVEMGQEFSQTYIENGAKQMYDVVFSEGKEVGDDKFGAEVRINHEGGYETFVEATFAGAIGGLLGGGMGGFHMAKGGSDIAQETMFGYINSSVKTKKYGNIEKLSQSAQQMVADGKITEEDGALIQERIKGLTEFATDNNTSGITDGVALYQMYQLDGKQKDIEGTAGKRLAVSENANKKTKQENKKKEGKVEQITERIQEHYDSIYDSRKPDTKNKDKFEERLEGYGTLVDSVINDNIDQETLDKRLNKLFDPKTKEKAQAKQKEAKAKVKGDFGKTYTDDKGIILTEKSNTPEAKKDITERVGSVQAKESTQEEKDAVYDAIKKDYGIEKEAAFAVAMNQVGDLKETTPTEKPTKEETPTQEKPKEDKVGTPKKDLDLEDVTFDDEGVAEPTYVPKKTLQTLTDEQLETKEANIQEKIDALGDKPNLFAIQRLGNEMKDVKYELNERAKEDKKKTEEVKKVERKENLSKQSAKRRRRKKRKVVKEEAPKRKISKELKIVDEYNVEYNGKEYQIITDEKGNIISLNRPGDTVRDEKVLIDAEIKRDRQGVNLDTRSVTEINEAVMTSYDVDANAVNGVDSILDENLTDEIAEVLDEGLPEEASEELMQKLDYYIDNVLDSLIERYPNAPYANGIYTWLSKLKTEIDEQYENEYKSEGEVQAKSEEAIAETETTSQQEQQQDVTEEPPTAEEQAGLDELVEENDKADQAKLDSIRKITRRKKATTKGQLAFGFPKDQRKRVDSYDAQLALLNPELYNEVKRYFKKIFPFIPVREVNNLGEKYGAKVLARLVESGIEIDPSVAIQTSLVHEYGHVFLEVLGDKHPLVKLGYKIINGTDFHKQAIEDYPDKTEAEQLNEALTEAIAVDSLAILERRLDGAKFEQFKEWLKSLWSRLKKAVGRANQEDVTRILAREMTLAKKPFRASLGSLVGMDKDQRKGPTITKRVKKTVDMVYESLAIQLLDYISDKNTTFDFKNSNDSSLVAFDTLLQRYYEEKSNPNTEDKIFENVDLAIEIKEDYGLDEIREFAEILKEKDSEIFKAADTVVNSMFKTNLEIDEIEVINDEADQSDEIDNKGSDNSIKATKRVSLSVRSILSSIVDDNGKKIGSDAVFSYIANIAQKTYKKAGLVKALKADQLNDPIARRVVQLINQLEKGTVEDQQKLAGFLQEISSLVQVKSEGANFGINKDGGKTTYTTTNPVRNKDRTYNGLNQVLENLSEAEQQWLSSLTDKGNIYSKAVQEFYFSSIQNDNLTTFMGELGKILNTTIDEASLRSIIDNFTTSYYTKSTGSKKVGDLKYTKAENFMFALGSTAFDTSNSLANVSFGKRAFTEITGYLDSIFKGLGITLLNNTFLNGANNTVTTTQLGHWVSTLNSMLMNDESGRVKAMKESPIYKNNPVFKYFVEQGSVEFSVFDSLKNFVTGTNVEYTDMTDRDYMMLQLYKFATSSSKNHYSQTLGVKSNRVSATFFEVPSFTADGIFNMQELRKAYKEQVDMLQPILTKMLNEANTKQAKVDLIDDFRKLYIHSVTDEGVITSGLSKSKHEADINKIKKIAKANNLDKAFSKKIGKDKQGNQLQFESFDQMVENFFFIEAINRTSLNDIYGGLALEYANLVAGNTKKGGVQQNTKRMSSSDSNGKQIEIDKPIHYIVYNTKLSGADSFKFNGSHLTEYIDKETGSLDPLGINSKELVFQVDPDTAQTVYIKSSGLNLKVNENGSTNLDGFGDNMKALASAMVKAEQMLATESDPNPYVVFMDSSASKGTHKFKTTNFQDLMDGNMDAIKGNVNTLTIDNLTTPFNLNKTLGAVNEQEAILSTQAAIIQFNAGQEIDAFEEAAVQYLKDKMKGKNGKPGIVDQLLDYDSNIKELTKDMNEREKSSTTEVLDAIKEYNADPENKDNKIDTFDHPSLKLVYEQFIASRLSKRGTRVEMPGNFMHQLPDFGGRGIKLEGKQVAVSWKMFFNENPFLDKENGEKIMNDFIASEDNKVAVVRIPSSAEMSLFGGTVGYFLDTDANVVVLSDEFVDKSDSDHDGDKAMVYRKEMAQDGKFISEEESSKTKMFNKFYENLTTEEFDRKRTQTTLSLEPIRKAVGEVMGDFATGTINQMVDVAQKMGLGQIATGRFAVAGKLMALLSQSKEALKAPIIYKGRELKEFTNKSLDDIARLLQAALDIGNDPILSETGFTSTTINVGNAMLLLGVDTKGVIEFLKFDAIKDLNDGFNKENLALSDKAQVTFDKYFENLTTKKDEDSGKREDKSEEELASTNVNGKFLGEQGAKAVIKYGEFKVVGDDLSKMIGYIKLDKGLPKNASINRKLMDDVAEFKDLSFTTKNLTERAINDHRLNVAKDEGRIFAKQLLTSNKAVLDIIEKASELTNNAFEFKKKAEEAIMKIFAQKQIKNPRKDVGKWMYEFADKIKGIKDFSKTGEYNITIDERPQINQQIKDIYNTIEANPLKSKDEVLMEKITSFGGDSSNLPNYKTLLSKYEAAVNDIGDISKFADNKFVEYLQVVEDENGRNLLRLDPKFKTTTQITQDIKDGFLELQEYDPQLAEDIISYQLYRHGVNNKIGSFIDVLPKTVDVNQLGDISRFKKDVEGVPSVDALYMADEALTDNIIVANKALLSKTETTDIIGESIIGDQEFPTAFKSNKKLGPYTTYNGNVYKKSGKGYSILGNIQGDENFTAFSQPKESIKSIVQSALVDKSTPKDLPNQYILTDGSILSLPNSNVSVDLGIKGKYSILPDGSMKNERNGNMVIEDSNIYFAIVEKYQTQQADNLFKYC